MSQRHVALFLGDLTTWQTKLSAVDSVINVWIEVQRTWTHLESIFIGSADIRAQLPQDSERFDGIGTSLREMRKTWVMLMYVLMLMVIWMY